MGGQLVIICHRSSKAPWVLIILLVLDDHYHGHIRRHFVLIFSIFSWQENEMFNPGKGSHPRPILQILQKTAFSNWSRAGLL